MESEMTKTALPRPEFVVAQALSPSADLLAWLARQPPASGFSAPSTIFI